MHALGHRLKTKAKNVLRGKSPVQAPRQMADENASNAEVSSVLEQQVEPEADLWQQAFAKLSEKQKQSLTALAGGGKPPKGPAPDPQAASIIPDLIAQTRARQEECEKRSWRIKLGRGAADEIILRDQAALVISWLTKAGDIGVQFAPTVVTHIWPCLKAILQIPVQEADQMAALLTVADKISTTMARGSIYEACFTTSTTPAEALKVVHHDLVALYQACLELITKTADLLGKNPLQRAAYSVTHPDIIKKAAGVDFSSLEAQLAHSVLAASAALDCKLSLQIRDLNAPVVRIDEKVSELLESVSKQEEQRILEWMSSVPYSSHHDAVAEKRMDGTCDWLLLHAKFQEWETSSGCTLLWLQGDSGTGKTFLTSNVIDRKKGLLSRGPNDESLAFFYFNRSDSSRNSALSCLQSLVRQLSNSCRRPGQMRPALKALFEDCKREARVLGRDQCMKQLAESIDLFPKTTIILDALDECNEDDHEDLVRILDDLMNSSSRPLLVFISGRPDIKWALRDRASVKISIEDNKKDIEKFVRDKIMNAGHRWRHIPEERREEVVSTLLEKSKGMFRWSALQVSELLKLSLWDEVRDRLGKLPKDLTDTYDEIYFKQGKNRSSVAAEIIDRAIMWVMAARVPLRSKQILSAVRINPVAYIDRMVNISSQSWNAQNAHEVPEDESYIVTTEMDADLLLEYCANLLTWNPRTDRWAFAHASVSEYFESHHFDVMEAHALVGAAGLVTLLDTHRSVTAQRLVGAIKCLGSIEEPYLETFLPSNMKKGGITGLKSHSFFQYVVEYWPVHVGLYDQSLSNQGDENSTHRLLAVRDQKLTPKGLGALLESFLGHPNNSSHAYRSWLSIHARVITHRDPKLAIIFLNAIKWCDVETEAYASFTMVRYGLFNLLQSWWQASLDAAVRTEKGWSEKGWSLLHLACCFDRPAIVEALLAAGANGSDETEGVTALSFASSKGHVQICRILIEKAGCAPDWPKGCGNPLYCATESGHVDVMRYLVSKGADPNRPVDEKLHNPLAVAAGRTDVLRVLVEKGSADPNMATIWAAYHHNYDALKYLVRHARIKINAHIPTARLKTVAIAFIAGSPKRRHLMRGKPLRRCCADLGVDFASFREAGGLKYISDCGYPDSALNDAVQYGGLELVQLLVEQCGIDVNYVSAGPSHPPFGKEARCALAAAANVDLTDEHSRVLEYLLDKGADVNFQMPSAVADCGSNPLSEAVYYKNIPLMEFLIKHGADVNLQFTGAKSYGSALAVAAGGREAKCEILVRCLLDHGADINLALRYGKFGSALIAACASRYWKRRKMVELLCDEGAAVNLQAEHGDHGSALSCAAYLGRLLQARCLLDHGADVNLVLRHGKFGSALMAAVGSPWDAQGACEREEMVVCLLDNGADVNLQVDTDQDPDSALESSGASSALMAAAKAGDEGITRLLVARGADVNRPENQGWEETLMFAVEEPRVWLHDDDGKFLSDNDYSDDDDDDDYFPFG